MKKVALLITPILFNAVILSGASDPENAIAELDEVIEKRDEYVNAKMQHIQKLNQSFLQTNKSERDTYQYNLSMSQAYQSFQFDSAFHYAKELIRIAYALDNPKLIARAKIEFANILISSGMFNEALDTLDLIELKTLSRKDMGDYYAVRSRAYFDMESFSYSQEYSVLYGHMGMNSLDSALKYLPHDEWKYHALSAQKDLKLGNNKKVLLTIDSLLHNFDISSEEIATLHMTKAFAYDIMGYRDKALKQMVFASMNDFMTAKKEAVAFLFLANYLFESGDVIRASKYINLALEDYRFYGSSFRLWQISQFLPLIKSQHIITIEEQKKKLFRLVIIISVLSVLLIGAFIIIFKQYALVKSSKKRIEKTAEELAIANRIKEEYIGYYFIVNTQLLEKFDRFIRSVKRKFSHRTNNELNAILNSLSIAREKENLLKNFDRVFLKIYPDFVQKFNKLLKKEAQIKLKEGQLLNTDLRIFALVRLGINDPRKIAKILDYSLHTIYSYKNRIKTNSIYPNDEFNDHIMKIKHF